ncbi:MAG: LytTR family transcriptional regulator DNA-binding domain-containing protein [Prolixibacteraceae bacterium]|nr:LytTR family transcriptional regulator DNA-binding domain-containing protein [Prolixibacteraceae bacterium]
MEFEVWQLWVVAAIVFVLLEIFIPSFVMLSIGLGCIFATFGALMHGPVALQVSFFIIGTLTGFLGVKPFMVKYAYQKKSIQTNASGLIGRIGRVVEEINPETGTGCVAIDGDLWSARSESDSFIPLSEKVKVIRLDSIIVYVDPAGEAHRKTEIPKNIGEVNSAKFLVRIGNRTIYVRYEDTFYLYSKNKITHIVTTEGKKFVLDDSLDKLEQTLPAEVFFRANRQYILKKDIISEYKSTENGKIEVQLKPLGGVTKSISVSRLKAHAFRQWINHS